MTTKREKRGALQARLARIERKCDMIIGMLRSQRASEPRTAVDNAIDRLHEAARSLREQSLREKNLLRDKFSL